MTYDRAAIQRAEDATGHSRKKIAKLVNRLRRQAATCPTDSMKARLLEAFLTAVEEVKQAGGRE